MAATLVALLDEQLGNLTSLKEMLDKELHLISSRDAESLMTLLHDKESLLSVIQELDGTINPQLASLQTQGELPAEINERIAQSQAVLSECRYCTQVNQKAVEQGQLRLQHLRNLMMDVRAKESLTYDKAGKKTGGLAGKGISA